MPTPIPPYTEMPTYWWALLETARKRGDGPQAAKAQRELLRLGVKVTYQRPQRRRKGGLS